MTARQNGGSNAPQPDGLFQPELFSSQPHRQRHPHQQPEQRRDLSDVSWVDECWGSQGPAKPESQPVTSRPPSKRTSDPPVSNPYADALSWSWPEPSAKEQRDYSLSKVSANAGDSFRKDAIACILREWSGREATSEDFRLTCEAQGIVPHHHNAWGGLTMGLKRMGALVETGELRAMKSSRSHARRTMVYRVVNPNLADSSAAS